MQWGAPSVLSELTKIGGRGGADSSVPGRRKRADIDHGRDRRVMTRSTPVTESSLRPKRKRARRLDAVHHHRLQLPIRSGDREDARSVQSTELERPSSSGSARAGGLLASDTKSGSDDRVVTSNLGRAHGREGRRTRRRRSSSRSRRPARARRLDHDRCCRRAAGFVQNGFGNRRAAPQGDDEGSTAGGREVPMLSRTRLGRGRRTLLARNEPGSKCPSLSVRTVLASAPSAVTRAVRSGSPVYGDASP